MRFGLGLIGIGLGLLLAQLTLAESAPKLGDLAPNWVLADTDGQAVSLYQQAEAGSTTVMVFFATWCRNCNALMPSLEKLRTSLQGKPVAFFLMNVWEDPGPEALDKRYSTEIPILLRADHVARRFGVASTPGIVVVGPDKRVIYEGGAGRPAEQTALELTTLFDLPAAK